MDRIKYILRTLKDARYLFIAILGALLYAGISLSVILYIHSTLAGFYQVNLRYTIPYTIFTLLLSLFFGVSVALFAEKIGEIRLKTAGMGMTGVIFGSLAAGCPGCFFGLFPFVLSLFGISATLAILPFNGLEFQVLAIIALCISIYTLAKETEVVCEIRQKSPRRRIL